MSTWLAARNLLGPLFGFGLLAFAIILLILVVRRSAARRFNEICARVAERLGGEFLPQGFTRPPQIQFRIDGNPALLRIEGGNHPETAVQVSMPRSPGTLKIFESSFAHSFLRLFGAQDLGVGDREFDKTYVVKANPPSIVSQVFALPRRAQAMASVRRLQGYESPLIDLSRETLTVKVRHYQEDEDFLFAVAETAIEFTDYLLHLDPEEGILWVEGGGGPGQCPVCGALLSSGVVRCDSCKTPHHEECWRWAGLCSTYACNGRRFVA